MSLNQPPPHDNEHSAQANGHAEHDDHKRPRSAADFWKNCQQLDAKRHGLKAEVVSPWCAKVYKPGANGYREVVGKLQITKTGEVECTVPGVELTPEEKAIFAAEIAAQPRPQSCPGFGLPPELAKVDPEDLFIFLTEHEREGLEPLRQGEDKAARHGITFVQHRIERAGETKRYLPWSYWDDGVWRPCEPGPDEPLPLYNLHLLKEAGVVYLHEGAKAARAAQEIAEGRCKHPWEDDLKLAVHLGWVGGATNARHVDWEPLKKRFAGSLTVVADNDDAGRNAVPEISRILKRRMTVVQFDNRFKVGFDLADDWPKHEKWWTTKAEGRDVERLEYKGPTLAEFCFPATWATDLIKVDTKFVPTLRKAAAEEWAYATEVDRFIHRATSRDVSATTFDALYRPFSDHKQTSELFKKLYSAQVDFPAYSPGRDNGGVFIENGYRKINLFRPSLIKPKQGDLRLFYEYMNYLFPDEDDRELVMKWCATLIARPEIKMLYGLLLVSVTQGVGKTTLGQDILAPLVGHHNVSYPSENDIVNGNFNQWQAKKRLAICNEIYGGHSVKAYNNTKSLITDKTVTLNEKHEKAYILDNHTHFIACSNSPKALQLQEEDRRYLVPRVVEELRPEEDWLKFFAYLDDGGLAHIMWWARDYVAKNGAVPHGKRAPATAAKREMIEDQRSPGMRRMFAMGEGVKALDAKKVVVLETALKWALDDDSVNPQFENREKMISMLSKAGLTEQHREQGKEVRRFKVRGMRTRVFANFQITPDMTWEKDLDQFELKEYPWFG